MGAQSNQPSESCAAVFLDRDGVLNCTVVTDSVPHPPQTVDELELLPGVVEALCELASLGFVLPVVTNQPDVARGSQTKQEVEAINAKLASLLPVSEIFTCYHDGPDNCDCRKPRAGLLIQAQKRYNIDLSRSFMVGDRWSDIVAGAAAGCKTLLVATSYSKAERCTPDYTVRDLPEAVELIKRLKSQDVNA
jgi:D-glycero-D-manno-heptose 1,7-bisphosphate phosphatase